MQYSVIIPVYNAKETLRRCLDSLVGQQFSDYELLLINDGSTDGSDAICREYANTYSCVRYFVKENGGVSLWTATIMCRLIILYRFLPH